MLVSSCVFCKGRYLAASEAPHSALVAHPAAECNSLVSWSPTALHKSLGGLYPCLVSNTSDELVKADTGTVRGGALGRGLDGENCEWDEEVRVCACVFASMNTSRQPAQPSPHRIVGEKVMSWGRKKQDRRYLWDNKKMLRIFFLNNLHKYLVFEN